MLIVGSEARRLLHMLGIAGTLNLYLRGRSVDVAQILRRQLDIGRPEVFREPRELCGAGNGNDPGLLGEQPGKGDLRRRSLLAGGQPEQIHQRLVGLPGFGREARQPLAEVGVGQHGRFVDRAGEEAPAERAEGNKPDAQLIQLREFAAVASRANIRSATPSRAARRARGEPWRARFGEAEVFHLARLDQFLHGAGDVFDRHVRIDAVLVEQVDARSSAA